MKTSNQWKELLNTIKRRYCLSGAQLADRLAVSQRHIWRLLNGETQVTKELSEAIADLYDRLENERFIQREENPVMSLAEDLNDIGEQCANAAYLAAKMSAQIIQAGKDKDFPDDYFNVCEQLAETIDDIKISIKHLETMSGGEK